MTIEILQAVTTAPTEEDAVRIARVLVDRRLAACVQIDGPLTSIYRWQGQMETAQEWRLTAKTVRANWDALLAAVRELHPYQVPEILAAPLPFGDPTYVQWVADETASGGDVERAET